MQADLNRPGAYPPLQAHEKTWALGPGRRRHQPDETAPREDNVFASIHRRSRRALRTTVSELSPMAAPANMGPPKRSSWPKAANGISTRL